MNTLLPADSKSTSVSSQNNQHFRINSNFQKNLNTEGEKIISLKQHGKAYHSVGLVTRISKMYILPGVRCLDTELLRKM